MGVDFPSTAGVARLIEYLPMTGVTPDRFQIFAHFRRRKTSLFKIRRNWDISAVMFLFAKGCLLVRVACQ